MDINWIGVLAAFVAGVVVAFLWYQKGPIADAWERLTGVTPERSRPVRARNMTQLAIANAVTATAAATGNGSVWLALLAGLIA